MQISISIISIAISRDRLSMSILKHALYCEMGLFRLAGLFRSYKNCITAIAQ